MAMQPSTRANVVLSLTDKMSPALRRVSAKLDRMATRARRAGMAMGAAAIILGTGLYKAANSAVELDNNMRKVQARITGIKPDGLKQLKDMAVELGGSTRYTIGQVSSLMATMAQAGIGVNGIKQMSAAMLDFATATGITLDEASAIATRTANAYGLEHTLDNITKVTDSLTYATINAQVNITEMGEAMEYASKTSKDYNQTIDTTATMLAFLGNVGITGSKAGTTLNSIYREMAKMDGGILRVNGSFIRLTDSVGDLRQLPEIFAEVSQAMEGMGGLAKASAMQDLFGRLGIKGAIVGTDESDAMMKMVAEMGELDGLTKKVALTMDAGIGGTLYRVVSAFDKLAVTIGNAIIPYIDMIAKGLTNAATVVAGMIEQFNWLGGVLTGTFLALAGGAVGLLAFAGVATVLATTFASISWIVSGIVSFVTFLLTPFGAIAALVTLIVGGLAIGIASFYDWGNLLDNIASGAGKTYKALNRIMGDVLDVVKLKEFGIAWELMVLEMQLALHKGLDDMLGKGWRPFFVAVRGYFRMQLETIRIAMKSAIAGGMALAAVMRGDIPGAMEWSLKFKGITSKDEMKKQLKDWAKEDADLLFGDQQKQDDIDYLKETIRLLKEMSEYTEPIDQAAIDEFKAKASAWVAPGSEWQDFDQVSDLDEIAKMQKEWAEQFEKVNYDTITSQGSLIGGSAASVSAKLSADTLSVAKDQLSTLVRIEKTLKKDRPDSQKGIWTP